MLRLGSKGAQSYRAERSSTSGNNNNNNNNNAEKCWEVANRNNGMRTRVSLFPDLQLLKLHECNEAMQAHGGC